MQVNKKQSIFSGEKCLFESVACLQLDLIYMKFFKVRIFPWSSLYRTVWVYNDNKSNKSKR